MAEPDSGSRPSGGVRVFITDVDSEAAFDQVKTLPVDGIVTNRIEVIGPLFERVKGDEGG